jgi:hypothetical protein
MTDDGHSTRAMDQADGLTHRESQPVDIGRAIITDVFVERLFRRGDVAPPAPSRGQRGRAMDSITGHRHDVLPFERHSHLGQLLSIPLARPTRVSIASLPCKRGSNGINKIAQDVRVAVLAFAVDLDSRDHLEAQLTPGLLCLDHAVRRVVVGQGERRQAQLPGNERPPRV